MTETSLRTRISVHATSDTPGQRAMCGLNLLRRDAITAGIHQFVRSAEMRDVAVIIDGAEVAADKPFATENLRFLIGSPPVAEHQTGVGAMHGDQTFGCGGQRLVAAGDRKDCDAAAGLRFADASRAMRHRRPGRDVGRDFAHAERFIERPPGCGCPIFDQSRRRCFTGHQSMPKPAQRLRFGPRVFQNLTIDAGNRRKKRRARRRDEAGPEFRPFVSRADDGRCTVRPRICQADAERHRSGVSRTSRSRLIFCKEISRSWTTLPRLPPPQPPPAQAAHGDMHGRQLWVIMAGVMLGLLLAALDQTVVGPAMFKIIRDLQGLEHYAWVTTAYLLTSTVTVPIAGKLGDLYGRKWFFVGGMVLFIARLGPVRAQSAAPSPST